MKVLKNIALIVGGFIAIIFICSLTARASFLRGKNLRVPFDGDTSHSQLIDDRDIIDASEEKRLNQLIKEYSAKLEMNIIIYVSGTKLSDPATDEFADNTYDQLVGKEHTDGVFYYMDFSGKRPAYDCFSVSGKAGIIYPHNLSEVTDKIVPYLPPSSKKDITQDDVIPGIERFLVVISNYVDKYSQSDMHYEQDTANGIYFFDTGSEFYVTKRPAPGSIFKRFIIASILGYIVMLIVYFTTKSKYKFKDKTNPGIYVAKGETTFSEKSDTFIRTYTTKTKIESSSSGGGHRSGGGGHSGGHRSGGSHR